MKIFHLHTEHSLKESTITIPELMKKAAKLGVTHMAITDTHTMTGAIEFYNACKKNGIKPILGVEACVGDEALHGSVVLLAKNNDGYRQISTALTKSPEFISLSLLQTMTDVVVLSASKDGYFGQILRRSDSLKAEYDRILGKQDNYIRPDDEGYRMNSEKIRMLDEELEVLTKKQAEQKKLAGKKYERPFSALEANKDMLSQEEYEKKRVLLLAQKEESKKAKEELPQITAEVKNIKRLRTLILKKNREMESQQKQWIEMEEQRKKIKQQLDSCGDAAIQLEKSILWFRDNLDFYIELQYHGQDREMMQTMAAFAIKYGIPTVLSNGAYMLEKDDYLSRQVMRSLQDNVWSEGEPDDQEFYLKEDLFSYVKPVFGEDLLTKTRENMDQLAEKFDEYDFSQKHYPKYADNSAELLRKKTEEGKVFRGLGEEADARLEYELDVICRMGFADYLLIVQDYIRYGKSIDPYGVGPGRGSAAGSLVCYCLQITNVNPLLYGLKFERFLNVERVSMPDIDVDFAPTIRSRVIEYVQEKYGKDSVSMIRTKLTQGAKAAIRNVARILGSRDHDDPKYFLSLADNMAKAVPNKPGITLAEVKDEVLSCAEDKKQAQEIYDVACKVENLMTGLSVHAAGVVIGDGHPLSDYVPLICNDGVWAASYDMVEVEQIGLLKMDFLGLRNLSIISECIERIQRYTGETVDLNTIPYEQEVFQRIFSEGNTESVFQFESVGMRNMLMRFKPSSFEDIILLIAAYRPGPIDSIPAIIEVKQREKKAQYCVPELRDILDATYGFPIYQEQLMDIFSVCAGFTPGEADIVRRNMSKKKVEKFMEAEPQFIEGLIRHGAKEEDAKALWESLVSFSAYAFNKSHAAAYAQISYQMAWLKYHYPEYYMCSVLNWTAGDKLESVLYDCKKMGIKVLPPDINRSGADFENGNGILYGLSRIKSVKNQITPVLEERKNGAFVSVADFYLRMWGKVKASVTENLVCAGAFDPFLSSNTYTLRSSLLRAIEKMEAPAKKLFDPKTKDKQKYMDEINSIRFDEAEEGDMMLKKEKELLCAYLSCHPLDSYAEFYRNGICLVKDFVPGDLKMLGIIRNIRIHHRKSDGSPMAFFDLEDLSDRISVSCFTEAYKEFAQLITDGNVVEIRGKGVVENGYDDGETINKLVVRGMTRVRPFKSPIFLSVKDRAAEWRLYEYCKGYEDEAGHPVWVHNQETGEVNKRKMFVKKQVLNQLPDEFFGHLMYELQKKSYL